MRHTYLDSAGYPRRLKIPATRSQHLLPALRINTIGISVMADNKSSLTIREARFPQDLEVVTELFTVYAKSLGIDLSYQNFEHELASLPGKYSSSNGGALFVVCVPSPNPSSTASNSSSKSPNQQVIGCVCIRAFNPPDICELKRLYIAPESRGLGAGRMLLEAAIIEAKNLGYKEMLLDTLPSMVAARRMYRAFGFEEVEKYYESPIEETSFMRLMLD